MLISYQDWMTRTKKGLLTTRSRELGTLDTAIEQFHQTRSVSNLINLRTHLAAWQKTKTDWKTSTRNTDSAGKHPVQELVKAVGTNAPPAVAAGKSTLTDQGHVANFASAAKHNVHQAWTVWSADERARVLYEAVSDIFRACGVPEPKLSLVADLGGDAGQFQFSSWTLAVASSYFQDNNVPNRHDFLEGAKTIYHEARHCEQWFHMARYAALGKNATTVASELEIPATIATHAIARKMMGADPMTKLTKGWYESVYSRSSREIDLTALKLKPTGNSLMQNLHKRFHNRYAAGLPEEKDAWDCERLLEPVYNWP